MVFLILPREINILLTGALLLGLHFPRGHAFFVRPVVTLLRAREPTRRTSTTPPSIILPQQPSHYADYDHQYYIVLQRTTRRQSRRPSSLTDDDDFAMVGFNTDVTPPSLADITAQQPATKDGVDWPTTTPALSEESLPTTETLSSSSFGLQSASLSSTPAKTRTAATTDKLQQDDAAILLGGLTEDGDFILEGVNAIDPAAGRALEKYGSPLVDPATPPPPTTTTSADNDKLEDNFLSQFTTLQGSSDSTGSGSSSLEAKNDNQILGLTEDGDLALVGFNAADPLVDELQDSSSLPDDDESYGTNNNNVAPSWGQPQENGINKSVVSWNDTPEEEVAAMTKWLLQIIPTLRQHDCYVYADQLVSLGLNPNCVTQCELRMDDLGFMKPLHQRYLFNEVTGNPHPWEP